MDVTYSSDGRRIAVGVLQGGIFVYDATTGEETLRLDSDPSYVQKVVFATDGTSLVSDGGMGGLYLWPGKR